MPLPDGFRWTTSYGNRFLHAGDLIVASYSERVGNDGWVIFAYRYRERLASARAPSEQACVRWLERWATANATMLLEAKTEPWGAMKATRDDKAAHKKTR